MSLTEPPPQYSITIYREKGERGIRKYENQETEEAEEEREETKKVKGERIRKTERKKYPKPIILEITSIISDDILMIALK